MPENDVEIEVGPASLASAVSDSTSLIKVNIGDYVAYSHPTGTFTIPQNITNYGGMMVGSGYSDQTFNRSNYTYGWKVFNVINKVINGETKQCVQLISAESVEYLYLRSIKGYVYAVNTLNYFCSKYKNSYAIDARSLGCTDIWSTSDTSNSTRSVGQISYSNASATYPSDDTLYTADQNIINTTLTGRTLKHSGYIWLASRKYDWGDLNVRYMKTNGECNSSTLYYEDETDSYPSWGVRPIITLNPEIWLAENNIGKDGSSIATAWEITMP